MLLFKTSGKTYRQVIKHALHAFPCSRAERNVDEFVLLSKNRRDCGLTEKQIQYVAKLLTLRPATAEELDDCFPGVEAGARWRVIAELYWLRPLDKPFNLADVRGLNFKRYDTVQEFAELDEEDSAALLEHLCDSNPQVIVDFVNNAERPDAN